MPWTVADVDKHKKGLTEKEKKQWVAIANSALSSCLKKGGKDNACEASAIRQANGSVKTNSVFSAHAMQANNYSLRTEVYEGKEHLVVPVVMMVEGVHNGSHGPILHTIEELGKFPGAWNGIQFPCFIPRKMEHSFLPIHQRCFKSRGWVGSSIRTLMVRNSRLRRGWKRIN